MTPGMEPTEYDQLRALLSPIHATPEPEEAPVTETLTNWTAVDAATETAANVTIVTTEGFHALPVPTVARVDQIAQIAYDEGRVSGINAGRAEANEQAGVARREGYKAGVEEGKRLARTGMRDLVIGWWKLYQPFDLAALNELLDELGLDQHKPIEQVVVTVRITVDTSDMNVSSLDDFNFDVDQMKARVYTDTEEAFASAHDVEFDHIEDVSW